MGAAKNIAMKSLGCPIQNEEYTEMKNLVYLAIVAALAMGFVAVEMGYT